MYSRETRVLLRYYLEQGVGKSELARRFGVSRRTVYHWIETAQLDRDLDDEAVSYKSRPAVSKKLDLYRGIIHARVWGQGLAAMVPPPDLAESVALRRGRYRRAFHPR